MRGQPEFFDVDERLKDPSAKGDALEQLNAIVDFEMDTSKCRSGGGFWKGGSLSALRI